MNGFQATAWRMYVETYVRTHGREYLGLQRLRRETKKLENSNERISTKMQKTAIFGHFWKKRPILNSFWPKWEKQDFFKKACGTFFPRLWVLTNCKVSQKSNERILRKRFAHERKNGKMDESFFLFKKALGKFFPRLWVLTNCKVSEKSNEWTLRNRVTNKRTDGQTRLLRSPRPVGRETKKHFEHFFRVYEF